MKLQDKHDINVFIGKLENIKFKLDNMSDNPPINDKTMAYKLLQALPDSWKEWVSGLRGNMDLSQKIEYEKIKTRIIQENQIRVNRDNSNPHVPTSAAFQCSICKKTNHKTENCFKNKSKQKEQTKRSDEKTAKGSGFLSFYVSTSKMSPADWIIDSGCSNHMCFSKDSLIDFKSIRGEVTIGNGNTLPIEGIGNIIASVKTDNCVNKFQLENVLYVPGLAANLISVSQATKNGLNVTFKHNGVDLVKNTNVIMRAKMEDGLYCVRLQLNEHGLQVNQVNKLDSQYLHNRMGHQSAQSLKIMFPKMGHQKLKFCDVCAQAKIKRLPFNGQFPRAKYPLQILHADTIVSRGIASIDGYKYAFVYVDDFTRLTRVYLTSHNTAEKQFECLKSFIAFAKATYNNKIQTIICDNGGEFKNNLVNEYANVNGITMQFTNPHTPTNNPVAERTIGSLKNIARSLLIQAKLPQTFWSDALLTAVYIKNRSPHAGIDGEIPIVKWFKSKKYLNYDNMKIFGCRAWPLKQEKQSTWMEKSSECILVGYTNNGYKLYEIGTGIIKENRHVKFNESKFGLEPDDESVYPIVLGEDDSADSESDTEARDDVDELQKPDVKLPTQKEIPSTPTKPKPITHNPTPMPTKTTTHPHDEDEDEDVDDLIQYGRIQGKIQLSQLSKFYAVAYIHASDVNIPSSYHQALKSPQSINWKASMDDELNSIEENETWAEDVLPPGVKPIDSKWVYALKTDKKQQIDRYKSRLTARGDMQTEGINYFLTFSSVPNVQTIRLCYAIAASKGLQIKQFDVKTAFLNSKIDETIYMKFPKGYTQKDPRKNCLRLLKGIYGIKQAARLWNKDITPNIIGAGLTQSQYDECLFYTNRNGKMTLLLLWVDDICIFSNDDEMMKKLTSMLKTKYTISEQRGDIFVGIEVEQTKDGLYLHQQKYIEKKIQEYEEKLKGLHKVYYPMSTNIDLNDFEKELKTNYMEVIGSLMYPMVTARPDIATAVSKLASASHNHCERHYEAAKKVLKYLELTKKYGLFYPKANDFILRAYADANYGGNVTENDGGRSTSGYCIMFGDCLISWKSKLQRKVALSTMESEYYALSECTKEVLWLRYLLEEIGFTQDKPTTIYQDNHACVTIAQDAKFRTKTRHIHVRHHFVRKEIEDKNIILERVKSQDMKADGFTKLYKTRSEFEKFREKIGMKFIRSEGMSDD